MQTFVPAIVSGATFIGVYGINKVSRFNIPGLQNNTNQSLNPTAIPFTPDTIQPIQTNIQPNNQSYIPHSILSPIEEEALHERKIDSFPSIQYNNTNTNKWECIELYSTQFILKLRNIVFISTDITRNALRKNMIYEYFAQDKDLFYHLRWQCRMQIIDKKCKIFQSNHNKELIIFHSDLHSKTHPFNDLYIIGIENDLNKQQSSKWKMIQFMTANEIYQTYKINNLPQPLRPNLYKTIASKKNKYINDLKNYQNINMKIEQIKKKNSGEIFTITYDELNKCIMDSIIEYEYIDLMSIIWFDKKENNSRYKIQILLPVKLRNNQWIGIVFDYNNNGNLVPVTICVDHIDIQRKLALFKPFQNSEEYKWFENNISEIKIINDSFQKLMRENKQQAKRIKYLEMLVAEQKKQIARLMG